MMEANAGPVGDLDAAAQRDSRPAEYAVDSQSPGLMRDDVLRDFVGSPPMRPRCAGVTCLVRRIVRNLRLKEVNASSLAVPEHLVLLIMFDEEPIDRDIVAIDHESVGARIDRPTHARTVVRAPDPGVI